MPRTVERQGCLLNRSKNKAARPEERRSRGSANGKKLMRTRIVDKILRLIDYSALYVYVSEELTVSRSPILPPCPYN
jgi:hypothetical protein